MKDGEVSEMIRALDRLVKIVGIIIIPIGIILFSQQHFINETPIRESVTATVAAIIGMIPEGLYLLASVALAVSVMRLATPEGAGAQYEMHRDTGACRRAVCR